jgi:CMP-N-acetylneuraminic acid synthetase
MKFTALLPIKFESQRVPNKNFKKLNGKELFKWILEKLISIDEVNQIIINTDAVKKVSLKLGKKIDKKVLIKQRIKKLIGHKTPMNKIIENDLFDCRNENIIMTHATNPLLTKKFILLCIKKYKNSIKESYDSLFTLDKFYGRFYDFNLNPLNHKANQLIQTQDLKPIFFENSNLYIFSKTSFKKNNNRIGIRPNFMISPKTISLDIDDKEDWKLAEKLIK